MKPFIIGLGGVLCLALLLVACSAPNMWVMLPNLSPPVVAATGRAFDRAEQLAKTIPNSTVLVAHGSATFTIYPKGTVLVIQTIAWENLRAGMTGVFYRDQQRSIAMTGGIITQLKNEEWLVPGVGGGDPLKTTTSEAVGRMTKERYIGVVAAAFIEEDLYDAAQTLRETPPDLINTCALRCHIAPSSSKMAASLR